MAPAPATPRRPPTGRRRGRPRGSTNALRLVEQPANAATETTSEPPPKRRRYIPGGPGGGGRFVDEDGVEIPADRSGRATTAPRARLSQVRGGLTAPSPSTYPRRERSTRTRTAVHRGDEDEEETFSSAAAVAAAVVQSDGYKPREERGWEEFHPNLDIEATFMVFHAEDVDGTAKPAVATPLTSAAAGGGATPANGASRPSKEPAVGENTTADVTSVVPVVVNPSPIVLPVVTPPRRRVGRPPRSSYLLFGAPGSDPFGTPRVPKVLPIHNQTPKERLDLKVPAYRKTDRILLFENSQARYVEKSMMNVGYQESDNFPRPERNLIKATDLNTEEDLEPTAPMKDDSESAQHSTSTIGRVEYDMDEQDDMWLASLNAQRKVADLDPITREIFEIIITKIEKEWHALEKRIPKPNPKPPQTHRPRSSSAAAVNGEPQVGEEQDSKCAICDDGDCENTNAIVFCDGCDLAVHQECYGVPFIPEGQWLCRKCQLIGRGVPTCIFCPNTDGAFKQTNSSKWAHLLCAMWIPEVSLGNHTFMEPVMDVEKVPRTRWKLTCYICNQRMGACIQCGNKACYQAFHVTCARRARLYLKMKNNQGALAVLDGSMVLKAFCDKHCPQDYAKENSVAMTTKEAKRFYRRTMKGRIWANSQASALEIAASHRHAITEHPPDESQMTGAKLEAAMGAENKRGQSGKPPWKLPTGAPVIPQAVYDVVESAMQRFTIRKRKDFVGEACRYWTLKREARRGAALLKRLQLQMETFSAMELTRRNFAAMGPSGKARLARRIDFAKTLIHDLEQLTQLSADVVKREQEKLEAAEMEQDFVDTCYFPICKLLQPVMDKAHDHDSKDFFQSGFTEVQAKLDDRYYTSTLAFAHDLCEAIHVGINAEPSTAPASFSSPSSKVDMLQASPGRQGGSEASARKRQAKRIFQYIKPPLLAALRAESDLSGKQPETLVKELEGMIEASLELRQPSITVSSQPPADTEPSQDVIMVDAPNGGQVMVAEEDEVEVVVMPQQQPDGADTVEVSVAAEPAQNGEDGRDEMDVDEDEDRPMGQGGDRPVNTQGKAEAEAAVKANGLPSASVSIAGEATDLDGHGDANYTNGTVKLSITPPASTSSVLAPKVGGATNLAGPVGTQNGAAPSTTAMATAPLTPPQSNGSLSLSGPVGNGHEASGGRPVDVLSEGGVPWYLRGFELQGTTAVEETWRPGLDAVRSLSEELTDMDDDELKGLVEYDAMEDEVAGTITAEPFDAVARAAAANSAAATTNGMTRMANTPPGKTSRRAASASSSPGLLTTRKTRAQQQLLLHAATRSRKGLRSSGRRR